MQGEEPKEPRSLTELRIQRSEVKGAKAVKICEAESGEEDAAEREREREKEKAAESALESLASTDLPRHEKKPPEAGERTNRKQ